MSKTLRTAALVVGAVALVATGVGAAAGAGVFGAAAAGASGTLAGVSVATIASVGTLASVGAGVLGVAGTLTAKKPKSSIGGDQTRFTANKNQGLPYMMGRTSVSGFITHRQTSGPDNAYQTFFGILSAAGPIEIIEAFKVDGQTIGFTGGAANGEAVGSDYAGYMWLATQRGLTPEPAALASPITTVAGWDASSKLSGYAAYAWTLKFDPKGKKYAGGVPEPSVVGYGVRCYDPRWDSTYPGGNGPCRANDESTWRYTDNAFLHGLTWLIGRHQNGRRVMGVGSPITGIDVPAYVEACNIALANGWKMGGLVYSTDEKWAALKAMLQAGGGEPCRIGATISCTIKAPRVSLDTIRSGDLVGEASVTGTQRRRERINAIVPRYRSEAHDWEVVPAKVVKVDAYVAEDGGQRTREVEYPLVQDAGLAAQLAAYDIVDAREFGPIVLPLKTRWIGYKPGDCLTIDVPELNLAGQQAIILNRSLDPSTGIVTLTLRSETAAKHDFALGRTPNPPPTPSLQVIDPSQLLVPGIDAAWSAVADDNGQRPEDGADVTGNNTAADSRKLGGTDAEAIKQRIQTAQDTAKAARDMADALEATFGQTEAANTARELSQQARDAAIGARDAAQGYSSTASTDAGKAEGAAKRAGDSSAAAASFYQLTASTGPGTLNQNPSFALWPDGQPAPAGWGVWSADGGATIERVAGSNGVPYALKMTAPAGQNVGLFQTVQRPFGAYVVEVTTSADNVSGAGVYVAFLKPDGTGYAGGAADARLPLLNKKDTSGWPGLSNGDAQWFTRTMSWFIQTPIDGGISQFTIFIMGNWEGFGHERKAKTITVSSVRIRPASEAEIAQHDPIDGLGAKASIEEAKEAATDAAGNALATARLEYDARFSGVSPTGLSNLIGQRLTQTQVDARVSDGIIAAAGPAGAIGKRLSAVEVRSSGRQNLVTAGSGERGMVGMTGNISGWYTGSGVWGPQFAAQSLSTPTGALEWPLFDVQAGETYTISADTVLFAAGGSVYVDIIFLDGAGNVVPGGDGPQRPRSATHDFSPDGAGKDAVVVSAQAPPGSVRGRARFVWAEISGLSAIGVRQMQVERGDGPWTPYNQSQQPLFAQAAITQAAVVDLQGKTQAYVAITAVAGNNVASVTVFAQDGAGGVRSGVLLGGNVFVDGNLMVSGSIQSAGIADFAVNGLFTSTRGSAEVAATLADYLVLPVTSTGRPILIQASGSAGSFEQMTMEVHRDGGGILAIGTGKGNAAMTIAQTVTLPAGNHVFRLKASVPPIPGGGGQSSPDDPGYGPQYLNYPALIVQEVKK